MYYFCFSGANFSTISIGLYALMYDPGYSFTIGLSSREGCLDNILILSTSILSDSLSPMSIYYWKGAKMKS
jgi:hypothetical protein